MAEITDLKRAYTALTEKATKYTERWAYYDGEQPLRFASAKLKSRFHSLAEHFTANWCAVIVESLLDRLDLQGITHEDKNLSNVLSQVWEQTGLALEAEDAHRALAVTSEAFIIADRLDEGLVFFNNPPEQCHMFYEASNPLKKRSAAKWWDDEYDEKRYLTLYYPDRIENYVSRGKAANVSSERAFDLEDSIPNPFNPIIPVFHFRRDRRTRKGELGDVIDSQDAHNKLFADMMMGSEYSAFKQRFIISNADTASLKNAPNELWEIPAGEAGEQPTTVGQFDATELRNFTDAMDSVANKIAVITRTPKHYLLSTGGDPSGEALLVAESGLVKKAKGYMRRCEVTWREIAVFILGENAEAVPRQEVKVTWGDPRTVQPVAEGTARLSAVQAGIPLRYWLERAEGWSEDELLELDTAIKEEKTGQDKTQGEVMLRALRAAQAGGPPQPPQAVPSQLVPGGGVNATPAM
jgi:hypothetical protein